MPTMSWKTILPVSGVWWTEHHHSAVVFCTAEGTAQSCALRQPCTSPGAYFELPSICLRHPDDNERWFPSHWSWGSSSKIPSSKSLQIVSHMDDFHWLSSEHERAITLAFEGLSWDDVGDASLFQTPSVSCFLCCSLYFWAAYLLIWEPCKCYLSFGIGQKAPAAKCDLMYRHDFLDVFTSAHACRFSLFDNICEVLWHAGMHSRNLGQTSCNGFLWNGRASNYQFFSNFAGLTSYPMTCWLKSIQHLQHQHAFMNRFQ